MSRYTLTLTTTVHIDGVFQRSYKQSFRVLTPYAKRVLEKGLPTPRHAQQDDWTDESEIDDDNYDCKQADLYDDYYLYPQETDRDYDDSSKYCTLCSRHASVYCVKCMFG